MKSDYVYLESRLNRALDSLLSFMCSRPCCYESGEVISPHSYVNLNRFMWDGDKFSEEAIKDFEEDTEHGIFHGVMTFLMASLIDDTLIERLEESVSKCNEDALRKKYAEDLPDGFHEKRFDMAQKCYEEAIKNLKIVPSCLFHDAYRCIFESENHDSELRKYFPLLEEATYSHSHPGKEHEDSILVRADRVELFRYKNHKEWAKEKIIFNGLSADKINKIKLFYGKIRPALEKAYRRRKERWIRHGVEGDILEYELKDNYPSSIIGFWGAKNNSQVVLGSKEKGRKYWSVEIGLGAINGCFGHEEFSGEMPSYVKLQGKLTMSEYKHFTGEELYSCILRDHLVATGKAPLQKWIFNHKGLTEKELEKVLKADIKICSEILLEKLLRVINKVINLFYAMKAK